MQQRALPAILLASAISGLGRAQDDRALHFAWPADAHAIVTNVNSRGETSFTLRFELVATAGQVERSIVLTRRNTRLTHWNGKPVPESKRPILAPEELSMDLLPAWIVDADGRFVGVEPIATFERRAQRVAQAWAGDDEDRAATAARIVAGVTSASRYAAMSIQTERQWDEWVGRWQKLDFSDKASDSYEGQIQLAMTGDEVRGRFDVEHAGPDPEREGHVRLQIDFAASGPRLDAAAIRWHEKLFDGGDKPFERLSMTVAERTTIVTAAQTLLPARIDSSRATVVTSDGEERRFEERRSWEFAWR